MWVDWGPRAMATAYEQLERIAAAQQGRHVDDELDEDGLPIVTGG